MVDMERFFEIVVFNYIFANGDDHLKNFSLILQGQDYRLAPAYDLMNTSLHVLGDDLGLDGGLSPNIEKSDVYIKTGHPCRRDFERFGADWYNTIPYGQDTEHIHALARIGSCTCRAKFSEREDEKVLSENC